MVNSVDVLCIYHAYKVCVILYMHGIISMLEFLNEFGLMR